MSPEIRAELASFKKATIYIDSKPILSEEVLYNRVTKSTFRNTTEILKKELKLSAIQIGLLKNYLPKETFLNPKLLVKYIKKFSLEIVETARLDEAISTVGGIALTAIDAGFSLKALPNTFVIGEMLDWDAPTGGFLLQGCFSSAYVAASNIRQLAASTNP